MMSPTPESNDSFRGNLSTLVQRSIQSFLKGRPEKQFLGSFDIQRGDSSRPSQSSVRHNNDLNVRILRPMAAVPSDAARRKHQAGRNGVALIQIHSPGGNSEVPSRKTRGFQAFLAQ